MMTTIATHFCSSQTSFTEEKTEDLAKLLTDEDKAKEILEASKSSMGTDISELDMLNISRFALKVVHLDEYRQKLHTYLHDKVSPRSSSNSIKQHRQSTK